MLALVLADDDSAGAGDGDELRHELPPRGAMLASGCKTLASSRRVQIFQSLGPKLALMMFVLALKAVGGRPWRRPFLHPYEIDCKSKSVKNRAYCVVTQRIYASEAVFEP